MLREEGEGGEVRDTHGVATTAAFGIFDDDYIPGIPRRVLLFARSCGWVDTQILNHPPVLLPTLGNTGQYLLDNRRIPLNIDPPAPDSNANSLFAIPLGPADKHLARLVDPVN